MSAASARNRLLHAACVSIAGRGVLILGPSGSGKSDLALRLVDEGAELVGDDQLLIAGTPEGVLARPAPDLAGFLEVRGLGVMPVRRLRGQTLLDLAIELGVPAERVPRPRTYALAGHTLPFFAVDPAAPSATARVRLLAGGARPRETLARKAGE
ncbi:MAG: HPr kinase/phosphatase C-terminal domain-containing protein [Azospirillaceae bacterium]